MTTTTTRRLPRLASPRLNNLAAAAELSDALWTIPAVADAASRLQRIAEYDAPAVSTGQDVEEMILTELAAGRAVPSDLADRIARQEAERAAAERIAAALHTARTTITHDLETAVRASSGVLFEALHKQLRTVLEDTRALGDLTTCATAEAAIAADRVDDHRRLADLEQRYEGIRRAQELVLRHLVTDRPTRYAELLVMPDPMAVFADFPAWRRVGFREDPDTLQRTALAAPWPVEGTDRHPARTAAVLRWAAATGAALWVPTLAELRAADALLHEQVERTLRPASPVRRGTVRSGS